MVVSQVRIPNPLCHSPDSDMFWFMAQAASLCLMRNMSNLWQMWSASFLGSWINSIYPAPVLSIVFRRKSSVLLICVTFVSQWFFGKNVQNLEKTTLTKDAFVCFSINSSMVEGRSCQKSPFSQLWLVPTHMTLEMVFEKSFKKEVCLMTMIK